MKEIKDIPGFIRMNASNSFIRNVDHRSIIYFINCVWTYHCYSASFGDQYDVVALKKSDKTWRKNKREKAILYRKLIIKRSLIKFDAFHFKAFTGMYLNMGKS